ncbi:hypothetical protein [Actinomadura atramentaria]|uniref:hypothetical protein n=1 Tax=Actinomadura atramentaria TaxID=1990 RepID=UPI0003634B38|nr:hypothetical protein [Actinomadura atramentaria]
MIGVRVMAPPALAAALTRDCSPWVTMPPAPRTSATVDPGIAGFDSRVLVPSGSVEDDDVSHGPEWTLIIAESAPCDDWFPVPETVPEDGEVPRVLYVHPTDRMLWLRQHPGTGDQQVVRSAMRLVRALLRRQLQAAGAVFLPAAALAFTVRTGSRRCITLIGPSRSGKTSLLLALLDLARQCARRAALISNDDSTFHLTGCRPACQDHGAPALDPTRGAGSVICRGWPRGIEVRVDMIGPLGGAGRRVRSAGSTSTATLGSIYLRPESAAAITEADLAAAAHPNVLIFPSFTGPDRAGDIELLTPRQVVERLSGLQQLPDPIERWLDPFFLIPAEAPPPTAAATHPGTLPPATATSGAQRVVNALAALPALQVRAPASDVLATAAALIGRIDGLDAPHGPGTADTVPPFKDPR